MDDIQKILDSLKNSDWWSRKAAIESLTAYPEDLYLDVLEQWLRDGSDAHRRNAAMETYRSLGSRALKSLVKLLKDDDPDVRIFSANVIGDIKDTLSVPGLIDALSDPDDNMKIASAESLGKLGDERAIEPLSALIGNSSQWVTMACIEAIGEIGGERAMPILCKCLEGEVQCGMTFAAIENAGDQHFIRQLTPFIDKEDNLSELALKAVVNIAVKKGVRPMPSYFMSLVPSLIIMQQSPQYDVKKAAFIALSWAEDIRGLEHFIAAMNNDDLQEYAVRGIISLGKRAVPTVIDELKKPRPNRVILAKVLSMLGEGTALLMFSRDEDPEVRTEVALAIGELKTTKAKDILLSLAQDEAEEVRAAAGLSLRNFFNEPATRS